MYRSLQTDLRLLEACKCNLVVGYLYSRITMQKTNAEPMTYQKGVDEIVQLKDYRGQ